MFSLASLATLSSLPPPGSSFYRQHTHNRGAREIGLGMKVNGSPGRGRRRIVLMIVLELLEDSLDLGRIRQAIFVLEYVSVDDG